MSLQMRLFGGKGYVPLAAPVLRSTARSAVVPVVGAPPWPPVAFWQTHSGLLLSEQATRSAHRHHSRRGTSRSRCARRRAAGRRIARQQPLGVPPEDVLPVGGAE